ncbi:dTDP-glucose 4,6-dehydratase [Crateriforma conspicua]|nr:dTDP-glucose 4,6-dehydratase [Crateriforma conspicua]
MVSWCVVIRSLSIYTFGDSDHDGADVRRRAIIFGCDSIPNSSVNRKFMHTVLVTGGAGFIGSHLVHQLISRGDCRVVNLDKLTYAGNLEAVADVADDPNYTFVKADVCDVDRVAELLKRHHCSAVIHLAAETHVDRSIAGPGEFVRTNVQGTFGVVEAAKQYWSSLPAEQRDDFRVVHVSTDEVYGSLGDDGAFDESSPYRPNSPYSASKAASDHLVRAYHQTYGLPTIITHCGNNYGAWQFPEKLIPVVIRQAVACQPIPVYGDGTNVRDWIHVSDHCRALEQIWRHGRPGEVYDVGGGGERSNLDIVKTVCRSVDSLVGRSETSVDQIQFVRDRPGHDFRYAIRGQKIRRELGWEPEVKFQEGIRETVAWYLDHLDFLQTNPLA